MHFFPFPIFTVFSPDSDSGRESIKKEEVYPQSPPSKWEKLEFSPLDQLNEKILDFQTKSKKNALKTAAFVIASIIPIIILSALALLLSPFILAHRAYRLSKGRGLPALIEKMKSQEEAGKLKTMVDAMNTSIDSILEKNPGFSANGMKNGFEQVLENSLSPANKEEVLRNKAARTLLKQLKKAPHFNNVWIQALKSPPILKELNINSKQIPQSFLNALKPFGLELTNDQWQTLKMNTQKLSIPAKEEVENFKTEFDHLIETLLKPQEKSRADDSTKINRQFIQILRKLIESPVYQYLKEDPSQPSIHLIHRCASDIWNKAPALNAYLEVGSEIIDMTLNSKAEKIGDEISVLPQTERIETGAEIAQLIKATHKKLISFYDTDQGAGKIGYALTHPKHVLGSAASQGKGSYTQMIPAAIGLGEYDSHGTLSNNPSLQGQTSFEWNGDTARVNNCYGGSPTIGNTIAPEFEAVLQAAENEQFKEFEDRDLSIPLFMNYNNLQNLNQNTGEAPRSLAIMNLNEKYPLSFLGSTFSKDSNFYMMKKKKDLVWENPLQFGKCMQEQLEKRFNTSDSAMQDSGFYFHGPKENWTPLFEKAIKNAEAHFSTENLSDKQDELENLEDDLNALKEKIAVSDLRDRLGLKKAEKDLEKKIKEMKKFFQGAFQEYVYSMLNAALEMESIKALQERGIKNPLIMTITACKENIDRGGMENAKFLYLRLPEDDKERAVKITTAAHLRAIAVRLRALIGHRMDQVLDLFSAVESPVFKKNQRKLFKELGYPVKNMRFEAATFPRLQGKEDEAEGTAKIEKIEFLYMHHFKSPLAQ